MSMHGLKNTGYHNSANESTLDAIAGEVMKARDKFPGTRFLLAALVEEVGELTVEIVKGDKKKIAREAIQVCAVAIRLIEEGDATVYTDSVFAELVEDIGEVARRFLQRGDMTGSALQLSKGAARLAKHGDSTFDDVTDAESKS